MFVRKSLKFHPFVIWTRFTLKFQKIWSAVSVSRHSCVAGGFKYRWRCCLNINEDILTLLLILRTQWQFDWTSIMVWSVWCASVCRCVCLRESVWWQVVCVRALAFRLLYAWQFIDSFDYQNFRCLTDWTTRLNQFSHTQPQTPHTWHPHTPLYQTPSYQTHRQTQAHITHTDTHTLTHTNSHLTLISQTSPFWHHFRNTAYRSVAQRYIYPISHPHRSCIHCNTHTVSRLSLCVSSLS